MVRKDTGPTAFASLCGLALLAGSCGPAWAAATDASDAATATGSPSTDAVSLQEVVVTATRRGPESVLQVPEGVDAFSGSTLSNLGIRSLSGLNQIDPSFEVLSSSPVQQRLVVRGIASETTQTVGIYMDDVPLLGGYNGNSFGDGSPPIGLYDMQQAQVLKGPQGTLFGAGSMSGTLLLTTSRPNLNEYSGYVDGSVAGVQNGNTLYNGTYAFNAPIIKDTLGVRFVGWTTQGGGYINKYTGLASGSPMYHPRLGNQEVHGWRASVLWQPADQLDVQFTAMNQDGNIDGPNFSTLSVGAPGLGYIPPPPHSDPWLNYDYTADWTNSAYDLYYLRLVYHLGFGNLIATSSYGQDSINQDLDTTSDACAAGFCPPSSPPTSFFNDIHYRDYTDEIRFSSNFTGPFQIVTGFFTQQDRTVFYGSALQVNPATGVPVCGNGYFACVATGLVQPVPGVDPVVFLNSELLTTHQYAVYAQANYKILPKLTLTLGGRYFKANINEAFNTVYFPAPALTDLFGTASPESGQSKPTYNAALLWQATPDWSIYGRVASGFRIGGVNVVASQAAAVGVSVPSTYQPDWLTDYELGTKIYLLDHRLYFDADVYQIDWTNQQLTGLAAGTYTYQLNAGRTKTDGSELSVSFLPLSGLTLTASATYTDSRLAKDLPPDVQMGGTPGVSGDRIPFVPKWSGSVRADYQHSLSTNVLGYVEGDVSYRGSSYTTFAPTSAAQLAAGYQPAYYAKTPCYYLTNLQIGARTDKIDVGLFVRNLTNRFAVLDDEYSAAAQDVGTAPPRTFGVDVKLYF